MSELSGFLERFDVDQDLAAFVDERKGSAAADFDVGTLDAIYHTHLRPTLDGLESTCRPVANALFRTFGSISHIKVAHHESNSSSLLERRNWERTRDTYIVTPGFKLPRKHVIELRHQFKITGYTGRGSSGFDMVLTVRWRLGDEDLSRDVTIDGIPIPRLDASIPYSTLDTRMPDVDRVSAEVGKGLMSRIAGLSADQPA